MAESTTRLVITKECASKESSLGGRTNVINKDLSSFFENFSDGAPFDTGLLPCSGSGMITYRKALGHEQIAYQVEPGIKLVRWGEYEDDSNANEYWLAQPYRIIIGDYKDGQFIGARHFFSPVPISRPDAPLYHVNLPNLNCLGYPYDSRDERSVGVGWICLYHTNVNESKLSLTEKLHRLIRRASGDEAYNDQNMSKTDGPRFYKAHYCAGRSYLEASKLYGHLWDPVRGQKKGEEEGFQWVYDPDIWIPVLVKGIDLQSRHVEDGEPLTYSMALNGKYNSYYDDPWNSVYGNKPINLLSRSDLTLDASHIMTYMQKRFSSAKPVPKNKEIKTPEPIKIPSTSDVVSVGNLGVVTSAAADLVLVFDCYVCKKQVHEGVLVKHVAAKGPQKGSYIETPVCTSCSSKHYVCAVCGKYNPTKKTTSAYLDGEFRSVCIQPCDQT